MLKTRLQEKVRKGATSAFTFDVVSIGVKWAREVSCCFSTRVDGVKDAKSESEVSRAAC